MLDLKAIWEDSSHRNFAESLAPLQVSALRDLLLVAGLADDVLTVHERAEIAGALAEIPGLSGTLDFDSADLIDHIDALYARHEQDPEKVLDQIAAGLGDAPTRRRAFAMAVHLMKSHGFEASEEAFARRVGDHFDLDDEDIEDALRQARSGD